MVQLYKPPAYMSGNATASRPVSPVESAVDHLKLTIWRRSTTFPWSIKQAEHLRRIWRAGGTPFWAVLSHFNRGSSRLVSSTQSTSTSIHNSWSSTSQVLEHWQWVVTTDTQIGRLFEFYSTETAKVLKQWRWWRGGRILIRLLLTQFKELKLRIRRRGRRKLSSNAGSLINHTRNHQLNISAA